MPAASRAANGPRIQLFRERRVNPLEVVLRASGSFQSPGGCGKERSQPPGD
jgi:hypothetical protein